MIRLWFRVVLSGLAIVASVRDGSSGQTPPERPARPRAHLQSVERAPEPKEISLTRRVRFERIAMDNGLSHSDVNTAIEDRRGFVWFGTADGLNRFDGHQMMVFRHDPLNPESMGGTDIESILEDDEGTLWLAHASSGVTRFDPVTETFRRYRHDPDDPNSLAGDDILTVFQDSVGRVWFSGPARQGGLSYLDPRTERITRVEAGPEAPESSYRGGTVWQAIEGDDGRSWLAADFLVEEFDPKTDTFTHYTATHPERRLSTIVKDANGTIWAGGFSGIYRVDRDSMRLVRRELSIPPIYRMAIDANGLFWVATDDGLFVVDRDVERIVHHYRHDPRDLATLPSPEVRDLLWSPSGVLWISTRGGVGAFHRGQNRFVNFGLPWQQTEVTPVGQSMSGAPDGGLWLTDGQDVAQVDVESQTARLFALGPLLDGPSTCVIHASSQDDVWFARGESVHRLDVRTRELYSLEFVPPVLESADDGIPAEGPPLHVVDIVEDGDGVIWIAALRGGLFVYDPESKMIEPFVPDGPPDPPVVAPDPFYHATAAHVSRSGTLWIGTQVGALFAVDPRSRRLIQHFTPRDYPNLPTTEINAIHDDADGALWLGTQVGLVHVEPDTGTFASYGDDTVLDSPAVESLLEDDAGRLWLGTRRGLVQFDPVAKKFRQFDSDDGLAPNTIVSGAWRDPAGRLAFADAEGFTMFEPRSFSDDDYAAPVLLTAFQLLYELQHPGGDSVLKRPIWDTSSVELDYEQNVFGFEFAALDYISPHKNRYRYRLDGFDDAWREVDSSRRFATYTHVPPGEYTFRVERRAAAGAWQEDGASIHLAVKSPWWMTPWARAGALLVMIATALGLHRARLSAMHEQNVALEQKVASRTAALEDANRRLELAATTDALTGVPNRRHYIERAELELAKLRRTGRPFTIGFADIDDFKRVNDELGHELGDRVLKSVAELLRDPVRAQDVVARWGGEEFILLFPETDAAGAEVVAEKIRAQIETTALPANGRDIRVTVTIGLAEVARAVPIEESIARADHALYEGKHQGKNCVVVEPPDEASPALPIEAVR